MRPRPLALGMLTALCLAVLALAIIGHASAHSLVPAHAKLGHADPGIGAILNAAPTKVTLRFIQDVSPNGSDIVVYDNKGAKVTTGPATVSASDAKTMTVTMQGDGSETYVVVFHTISAQDGHAYTDAYQFTVSKAATPSAGQRRTPLATVSPACGPRPAPPAMCSR